MEVVDGMHVGQSRRSLSNVGRCRSTPRVPGDTLMTPDHTAIQVRRSGYGRPDLVSLLRMALTREGSDSKSMQPVGCTLCSLNGV